MTMWIAVLLACVACFALKFVGYLVPESWVSGGRTSRITTLLPVALLAGLLAVQTLVGSGGSPFDAAVVDAKNAPTDRYYAYANVRVFQSGKVQIDAYGFADTYGPTQLIKSITLAH